MLKDTSRAAGLRALFCVYAVVDDEGNPLFTLEDLPQLGKRSSAVLDRVATVALRLNGIGVEAQKDVEKNLPAAPSGASTSA
jgi:hypothetical protein